MFFIFFREIFDMVASERRLPIYRAQRLDGHFDDWGGVGCVRPTFPKKKLIAVVERKKTSLTFLFFTFSLFNLF